MRGIDHRMTINKTVWSNCFLLVFDLYFVRIMNVLALVRTSQKFVVNWWIESLALLAFRHSLYSILLL